MRILFDNSTPRGIGGSLTAPQRHRGGRKDGDRLTNGDLLDAAEQDGFEVLVTPDQNIRYQQNLAGRKIALVILSKGQWPCAKKHAAEIAAAVNAATPGSHAEVQIREGGPTL